MSLYDDGAMRRCEAAYLREPEPTAADRDEGGVCPRCHGGACPSCDFTGSVPSDDERDAAEAFEERCLDAASDRDGSGW